MTARSISDDLGDSKYGASLRRECDASTISPWSRVGKLSVFHSVYISSGFGFAVKAPSILFVAIRREIVP